MNVNDTIERKIRDYFNGQLPAYEEAELIQWLKLDEKNKAYFFSFKKNLDPQKMQHTLLQSSYTELKSKLLINQEFNSKLTGRVQRQQLSSLLIAAMLLIAAIGGFSVAYLLIENNAPKAEVV